LNGLASGCSPGSYGRQH